MNFEICVGWTQVNETGIFNSFETPFVSGVDVRLRLVSDHNRFMGFDAALLELLRQYIIEGPIFFV